MSDSEVNWLKTGTFTFRFETLPPSSCLSHLTLLVSHLSSRDKLNLICDAEVCAGLFEVLFCSHEALVRACSTCITVRVQAVPVHDKNEAQICCSERTSGMG